MFHVLSLWKGNFVQFSLHFSKYAQASISLFPGRVPAESGSGREWALSSSQAQSSDLFHEDDLSLPLWL